ncbi:MAG: S8 family serine peptidase [Actinomycetota bacterium]
MTRRSLAIVASLLLLGLTNVVSSAGAAPRQSSDLTITPLTVDNSFEAAKSPSSSLAETDRSLLNLEGSKPVNVVVKFDYDAAATYAGGVQGLAATSPEVTGRALSENLGALRAYRDYAKDVEASVIDGISSRVPQAEVLDTFRIAYGGAAMTVPANQVEQLLEVDGVVAVQRNQLAQPQTDASPEFIGATEAWEDLGGSQTAGEGVIVGVLDTGVWPEADSYLDPGVDAPEGDFPCEFGDGTDPALGDPFECNDKLVGAYAFTDTYMAVQGADEGEFCNSVTLECSARDADGHGTHTSTTAAGSPVESAELFGIERGPISGIAPGAHIIGYRVCLAEGCFTSDSVAAVEQAIMDDIDVINFSISGGANAYTDAVELAFLDAYSSGILVNASAGNNGPGAGTANHAGPWTNTVGASTSDRHFITTLGLAADNGDTLEVEGVTITPGIEEPTEVVQAGDVAGYEDQLCQKPMPAGSVEGLVVVCERGVVGRVEKSFNVAQGGAAGMIMYNATNLGLNTDNHFVPSVHVEGPEPAAGMVGFLDGHEGVTAQFETGQPTEVRGDVMTSFSSRGPLGDFIKPDVTAPGIQILAGNTPEPVNPAVAGPPGENYMVIAGTSMSSPHSAGASALVKAGHPDWTPGQIKSALMTSSVQDVLKEDGVTPSDPFDRGAGSIRANRALEPKVTFDVTAEEYFESAADPLSRINLNLPSVNAPVLSGQVTTTRTAMNVTSQRQEFAVRTDAPEGSSIEVSPKKLNIRPGESQTMTITIDGEDLADGQYFGQISLNRKGSGLTEAVLPVAFNKTDSDVALTHSCSPDTIAEEETSGCSVTASNFSSSEANATIEVEGPKGIDISNPQADPPGDLQETDNAFTWSGSLEGADAPTVDAITPGGESYFSLASLGVAPLSGFGDETIGNLNTAPYLYGSETYNRLGIVSNGYLVVGGGTSEDVEFAAQPLPDPAAPNNVLAPFWTDLNPGAGGNIYAANLTDGVKRWIVVEYEDVPVFDNNAELQTFQVWIETTAGIEAISYAYDTIQGDGDAAGGLVVGAENRDGTSGVELGAVPAGGESYAIETSPPAAGGSVTITYDATGEKRGEYQIPARMTTDVTVGTTTELALLTVTRR